MRFHLNFVPPKNEFSINHSDRLFFIGSCFSDHIGEKLSSHRFQLLSNPFGNLFNPFSISRSISDSLHGVSLLPEHLIERDQAFFSFKHHSSILAPNKDELVSKVELLYRSAFEQLKTCNYLFITFGTAFYYYHKANNMVVANCHKQHPETFIKRMASPQEISEEFNPLIQHLRSFNPQLKIVFTVSPVKHLRDGLVENSHSKSVLLVAVHQLIANNANCSYFPAFELINDDLRDHRFYEEDLAHPNALAIDYVWEKFSTCFFNTHTSALNTRIAKYNQALQHVPIHSPKNSDIKFQEHLRDLEHEINKMHPGLI